MFHLGRTVGADKRGLHTSSTGDIELNSFVEASSQTKAAIGPSAGCIDRGRLRKQEKDNL